MKTHHICRSLLSFIFLFGFFNSIQGQQISIPREGFPFCEPFTSEINNTRAETILGGSARLTNFPVGNGALLLTEAEGLQTGHAFIDIPFSPKYGIKASFEYFSYGGTAVGADGLIFFMFDGKFGKQSSSFPFTPGGQGGSLSYSPRDPLLPGMSGGYIAVSLDEYGNFAYSQEGKITGIDLSENRFDAPDKPVDSPILHSILVRGPAAFEYPYLDNLHKYTNDICSICVTPRFTIDSPYSYRVEDCADDGYRKVFIDLKPSGTNQYTLTMYMLVNTGAGPQIISIFDNVPYPYDAPDDLKIGFAASTGGATNIHEIKNVVVEVSEISDVSLPQTEDKNFQICEFESNLEIKFPITLPDPESFIRCIQLYEIGETIPTGTTSASSIPTVDDCGFGNSVCSDLCDPVNFEKSVIGGTFKADLQPLFDDNIDLIGNEVQIQFLPESSFVGTSQIIYTVTDNFGLTSEPKTITVVINPDPIKFQDPEIEYPSCDGQSDGTLTDFVVKDLVPGFDYEWFFNGVSLGKDGANVSPLDAGQASFGLQGLNIGTYTLLVWNPSDYGRCIVDLDVLIDQQEGTPIKLEIDDKVICENQEVSFVPFIEAQFSGGLTGEFNWYLQPDRNGPLTNGQQITLNGQTVLVNLGSTGEITLIGLTSNGNSPQEYFFYTEAKAQSNPTGDFCPYKGDVLTVAKVSVFPSIDFEANKTADDWCLVDPSGGIEARVSNANASNEIKYFLTDTNGIVLDSNSSGDFLDLAKGMYEVYATSSAPVCASEIIKIEIFGPDQPLFVEKGNTLNTYCGEANGALDFTVTGGNSNYTFKINGSEPTSISNSGNIYTISGLSAGTFTIEVGDDKGCLSSIEMIVSGDSVSEFSASSDEICQGETAVLRPERIEQSSSIPSFSWFHQRSPGDFVQIIDGSTIHGATHTINAANELLIEGLVSTNSLYEYFLLVTGLRVCDQGYISASVKVNPLPELGIPKTSMISCFGESNGSIEAILSTGNLADFTFGLVGDNGVSVPFQASPIFPGLPLGKYELSVKSVSNCRTVISGITIIQPSLLEVNEVSSQAATCGESNGELVFEILGGTPNALGDYSITINGSSSGSSGTDFTKTTASTFSIINLSPRDYLVEIKDTNGCLITFTKTILDTEVPVFTVLDIDVCEGQPAVLTPVIESNSIGASPVYSWALKNPSNPSQFIQVQNGDVVNGVTYSITNGVLAVTGLLSSNTPYKYYLTVSGNLVCPGPPIEVEIRVLRIPDAVFQAVPISCFNGNDGRIELVSVDPSGSNKFTIIETGESNDFGNFTGLKGGSYNIRIQETGSACFSDFPVTLSQPDELVLTTLSSTNPICGESNGEIAFEIIGGTPDYQILLNGNLISTYTFIRTGQVFEVSDLAPGSYVLEVRDANGCVLSVPNAFVLVNDQGIPVNMDSIDVEFCFNDTAVLVPVFNPALPGGAVLKWFKDQATTEEIVSSPNPDPSNGIYQIDGSGALSIKNLTQGKYTYYLEIAGPGICTRIEEVNLQIFPEIVATFDFENVSCFGGNDGSITLTSAAPAGAITYTIVETGDKNTTGIFNNLISGNYTIRAQEIGLPCIYDFPVTLSQPDELVLTTLSSTNPICGESNGEIVFEVIGGTPDYQILLNGNLISTYTFIQTGQVFEVSDLSPGSYVLEVTDANGCVLSVPNAWVLVNDQGIPVNMDSIDVEFCFNDTAVLVPVFNPALPGGAVLKWFKDQASTEEIVSSPNPDPSNVIYQIDGSGALSIKNLTQGKYIYYLEIAGPGICTGIEEVNLQIFPEIVATFDFENVSCFGGNDGSITLTSAAPAGTITYTIVETGVKDTTGIFNNLISGTYTIRAQENGSPCTYDFPFTLSQPDELLVKNPQKTNPTCGESNGSMQFDLTGGTPDYVILVNGNPISDYSSSINGSIVVLKNLPPSDYSVSVTDANGCFVAVPNLLTLVNDEGVDVNINPLEEAICVGGDAVLLPIYSIGVPVVPSIKWYKDATLFQRITNGTDAAGISYQINPANGELTIQGLQLGDYTYYVEISDPGICSKIETVTVEVFPEIIATIDVENVICFGDTNGSIQIFPTGGNGNFEISLNGSPFKTSTSYTDLQAGPYTVSIRNDLGCLTEIDVEILGPSEPISINDPTIIRASCGLENGSIGDLMISGGWGDYNVEWRKGSASGPVVTGGPTGAADLSPDTYFLSITDSVGCSSESSFMIGGSSDPVYAAVPPINSCIGNPVEIRPIHLAPDPTLPPAAATEVRWYSGPGQTGLIENGQDSALSSITYTIDDSDWLNPKLLVEGLPAGTHDFYFYVVCTGQEIEIEVIVFDTPEVELETDKITCFGETNGKVRVISGADPSYSYSVNGAAPVSLTALESETFASGNYNFVVATPAGCSQDLTFVIEGPSAPLTSIPLTKIDPGCGAFNGKLILTVSGGWPPYTLEVFKNGISEDIITTSETNVTLDGNSFGIYKIEITDAEGCVVSTNEVTLVDGPTQVLVTGETICEGEVATLIPTLDPAANGSTFLWFFDQGLTQPISSSPNPATDGIIYQINEEKGVLTITGLPQTANPFNYYVTASGPTICNGFIGQGNVIVVGSPTATATVRDEVCFGEGGVITVNASGGSGNYTYSLNGGTFGTSNIFVVYPGNYSIEIRSQEGCSFTLNNVPVIGPSAALRVNSLVQNDASCGLDNGEIRFTIEGGYVPYSIFYSKNGTSPESITSPDGQVRVSNLGLGSYAFTVLDAQGCELILSSPVPITEVPTTITASGDQICEGETAEIAATVPQNIPDPQLIWSFDAQGNSPITSGEVNGVTYAVGPDGRLDITGLLGSGSPFIYYVSATGTGICGLSPEPVKVIVDPLANLRVSNPSIVCDPNGRVDLTDYIEGFNPSVYDYNVLSPSGSAMQFNEIENVALSGDYRISSSVKGTNCWNQPQRIRVLIAETKLIANFQYEIDLGGGNMNTNGDIQIEEDVQFRDLTSGSAIIWNWSFGDGNFSTERNPVHQFQTKGSYMVVLTTIDKLGCQSEFQILVNVFDDYIVMIPNAFTPGGVKNKFFKPQFRGISSMEFFIFDTWGELIYHAKSLEDVGWDGTLNGVNVPNGNYVFRGRFVSRSGEKIDKSGVFILIR